MSLASEWALFWHVTEAKQGEDKYLSTEKETSAASDSQRLVQTETHNQFKHRIYKGYRTIQEIKLVSLCYYVVNTEIPVSQIISIQVFR